MLGDRRRLLSSVSVSDCLSICTPSCPYNSETVKSIEFKFGGQILNGYTQIPPNLVKFERKFRIVFLIFNWACTEKSASLHHVHKSVTRQDFFFTIVFLSQLRSLVM